MRKDLSQMQESYSGGISVCMITYQHAPYITRAIESVLAQKTLFPCRLVIGEDGSRDGTREICQRYAAKYPSSITVLLRERHGKEREEYSSPFMYNFVETLKACEGKYVALLEGDDYWTDPLKLQKQYDYLEKHPDVSICGHRADVLEPSGTLRADRLTDTRFAMVGKDRATLKDLITVGNFLQTSTVVFRNSISSFPEELRYSTVGDYLLFVMLAGQGDIFRMDDTMSVFRNGVGVWSSQDALTQTRKRMIYQACTLSYLEGNEEEKRILLEKLISEINTYNEKVLDDVLRPESLTQILTFKDVMHVFLGKIRKKWDEQVARQS